MPATIQGLPTHALVVHATVILVPLVALLLVLCALWPRVRRALGPLPVIGAALAVVLVPITTSSGEKLRDSLGVDNPLIARHQDLAMQLLPWAVGLFAAALLLLVADGWRPTAWATPSRTGIAARARVLSLVLSVVVIALAVVTVVEVVRIGHSGAEAVWQGVGAAAP